MKKLGYVVFSTVLLLCLSACKNGFSHNNNEAKGSVTLNISQNARTIVPEGFSNNLNNINSWNVTFDNGTNKYNTKVSYSDLPKTFSYPVGVYTVSVTGEYSENIMGQDNPVTFTYSGKLENVVLSEDETKKMNVIVSLNHSSGATGNFAYEFRLIPEEENEYGFYELFTEDADGNENLGQIIYDNDETKTEVTINEDYSFRSYLSLCTNPSVIIPLSITDLDLTKSYMYFKLAGNNIPVGSYFLTIEYDVPKKIEYNEYVTKTGVVNIEDPVVVIVEGLTSTTDLQIISEFSFYSAYKERILYVSNNGSNNIGLTPQNCADLNKLFAAINENKLGFDWEMLELYFIPEKNLTYTNYFEKEKDISPFIDINNIPTKKNDGKIIYLDYVSSDNMNTLFSIHDGQIYYMNDFAATILSSETPAEYTVTITDSESIYGLYFVLDNVKLNVVNGNSLYNDSLITISGYNIASEYIEGESEPILTIEFEKSRTDLSELSIEYIDIAENSYDSGTYTAKTIVKETEDKKILEIYTAYKGSKIFNYSENVPNFTIEAQENGLAGISVFTIEPESSLAATAQISWFVNNHKLNDENDLTLSIILGKCPYVIGNVNTISAVIENNGEYRSQAVKIAFAESESWTQQNIYFNPDSSSTGYKWVTDYDRALRAETLNEELLAYCYDSNRDLYVAVSDSDNKFIYIYKYKINPDSGIYNVNRIEIAKIAYSSGNNVAGIASDGKNVYLITKDRKNAFIEFGNSIYVIPIGTASSNYKFNENNAEYSDYSLLPVLPADFTDGDKITAITCDENYLYVAGEKIVEEGSADFENDTIDLYNNNYYVQKYTVTSDNELSYEGSVYSYDDKGLIADYAEISQPQKAEFTEGVDSIEYKISLDAPIIDMSAYNGSIYILRAIITKNEYKKNIEVWGSNDGYRYISSLIHVEAGKNIARVIDIPTKLNKNYETEESTKEAVYPSRIIAVKPKKVILADGSDKIDTRLLEVDVYSETTFLSTSSSNYGFDSILNGSGGVDINNHDVKVFTIEK